ncbi:flagellar hook-basal body complex protein [Chitinivorax sp. B]|uniref:flagellar hook-basal body protein n=1 Tax=Chitinivorax sp. B TaxID=2502235 RepID=UPI0010F95205|nr:flagellar hook-basal body complex protein [Chitinivorax sp. B]
MIEALYIGANGMGAQQTQIDAIANNLSNMNTPGFKKSRVNFQEVIAQGLDQTQQISNVPVNTHHGVSVAGIEMDFSPGTLKSTNDPFDLSIQGTGFIPVQLPDGTTAYSRGGSLKLDSNRVLTTQAGYPLQPMIQLPEDVEALRILADGRIEAAFKDNRPSVELGRLELVNFNRSGALKALGGGIYQANEKSGEAISGQPGTLGLGTLSQGALENANIDMISEMVSLMLAQRAYEMGSKLVQASDELMGMTNNLRR